MPLTEFLRMSKQPVDANQQKTFTSTDPTCRRDTDFAELVWENGQIMMQGQSSKARKNPVSNNFQTSLPKAQDVRNTNGSRMGKFSTMDSVMADFPLPVSSCEMGLDQDVDIVPWLNYPIEDPLHNDYTSEFLPELSGITINDPSAENHLASREKKSSFHGDSYRNITDNSGSMKHEIPEKTPSIPEKRTSGGSSEVLQFSLPFQHRSDIGDATGNTSYDTHQVTSRDFTCNPSSLCAFTSLRLQRLNAGQPSTSSSFTNFSYFARPPSVGRSNVNSLNKSENDGKRCTLMSGNHDDSTLVNLSGGGSQKETFFHNQSVLEPANINSESVPAKPIEEFLLSNQDVCQDVTKNKVSQNQEYSATTSKERAVGESNMEPMVATSSVCSGNSVERASNEPAHDLKRKSVETGESDGPSEELEEESVGARKVARARTGSKRSRAAEVHNLSERKRRDRINEKMRALQELIPNCNKVDKASLLDEAIEYLKTLQLQVQMLSMGAGLYMQPMMVPPGMQPIHGAHMPHFSPMGIGMGMGLGMGMGYGMNMLDMNGNMTMMPSQGTHYPVPAGPSFQGMPGSSLQAFRHLGQGLPMSMQTTPVLPVVSGIPSFSIPVGPNVSGVPGSTGVANLAPSSSTKDAMAQVMPSLNVNVPTNQASNQATNKGTGHCNLPHDQPQLLDASKAAVATNQTGTLHS